MRACLPRGCRVQLEACSCPLISCPRVLAAASASRTRARGFSKCVARHPLRLPRYCLPAILLSSPNHPHPTQTLSLTIIRLASAGYLLDLVESHRHVIYSDVDTVWLRDPRPFFTGANDAWIPLDEEEPVNYPGTSAVGAVRGRGTMLGWASVMTSSFSHQGR